MRLVCGLHQYSKMTLFLSQSRCGKVLFLASPLVFEQPTFCHNCFKYFHTVKIHNAFTVLIIACQTSQACCEIGSRKPEISMLWLGIDRIMQKLQLKLSSVFLKSVW